MRSLHVARMQWRALHRSCQKWLLVILVSHELSVLLRAVLIGHGSSAPCTVCKPEVICTVFISLSMKSGPCRLHRTFCFLARPPAMMSCFLCRTPSPAVCPCVILEPTPAVYRSLLKACSLFLGKTTQCMSVA